MFVRNPVLVNGVNVTENLRGQALNLIIEDAVQETTVATAGVSAEFGRFGGGVINVVTKSGGNTFSGTFRDTLNNDNWRSYTLLPAGSLGTGKPDSHCRLDNGCGVRDQRQRSLRRGCAVSARHAHESDSPDVQRYRAVGLRLRTISGSSRQGGLQPRTRRGRRSSRTFLTPLATNRSDTKGS